jgi:sec-independent protein translocase protein TatA
VPNIGFPELLVVLMILVLVFGASRLPQLGDGLGRAIRNFKRGIASDDRITVSKDEADPGTAPKAVPKSTPVLEAEDAEIVDRKS